MLRVTVKSLSWLPARINCAYVASASVVGATPLDMAGTPTNQYLAGIPHRAGK